MKGPESPEDVARRVLFAESLEEKLAPFRIADASEPTRIAGDLERCEPGRPDSLRFSRSGEPRPALPARPALVEEESRGVLLHFFANHELLAAELMALAILKFPDAPVAFRRGLLQTLGEEQRHTRWYRRRLRQCGVEFGQYPVNRFFWDAVASMECPLDYVSRLSLTFEQANLDYSRHYAEILREAGDSTSSAILERIYRDEISHVGYGLHWFRKWKEPGLSDWEALERRLPFPLSPSRAKGNRARFNAEGRREAGLDETYIRKLSVFERSHGRTPNVHFFNPEAENRVASLPDPYHPPKRIRAVIEDLEFLSTFLARRDDVVLLRHSPPDEHLAKLRDAGFHLPEYEVLVDGRLGPDSLLRERKIDRVLPWSKAPDLAERFGGFISSKRPQDLLAWHPDDHELFRKSGQARVFEEWFGPSRPIACTEELEEALARFRSEGVSRLVWKPDLASAGSGMRITTVDELTELLERSDGAPELGRRGGCVLEPCHERVLDFSVQFEVSDGMARRIGLVRQLVTPEGGYRGSLSVPKFCLGLGEERARLLMERALPVYEPDSPLVDRLARWAAEHGYEGPVGIDSYLYRDADGLLGHRPVCEINCRNTMGRIAHELRRCVAPGHGVRFEIRRADDLDELEDPDLDDGRLAGGSLLLTPRRPGQHFAATLTVARQVAELDPPAHP